MLIIAEMPGSKKQVGEEMISGKKKADLRRLNYFSEPVRSPHI
jgi:hypothetical protein